MDIFFFIYENLEWISQYYSFENTLEKTDYNAFN